MISPTLRIAIVAAEPSGDLLGGRLMAALRERHPQIHFEGIGGPQMLAQDMRSFAPLETLSVMGLVEVLRHLPRLLRLRAQLRRRWLDDPPDLFIGVDAPDFNLQLETDLRAAGVKTVHYVCPTVWAWRPKRVMKIRAAVDLLLAIFPFEPEFLQRHGVRSAYIGHTLASEMPMDVDVDAARQRLGLDPQGRVLALLPGSRASEVGRLARPFLQAARECSERSPGLQFAVPLVNEKTREIWRAAVQRYAPGLSVVEALRDTRSVFAAADVALVASGTATFEGLLSKRPMVVGYKVNSITYWVMRLFRMLKIEHVAMANLLSEQPLAPEFIQAACEPEQLVPALMTFFEDPHKVAQVQEQYARIHAELRMDTDALAAQAVLGLLAQNDSVV